MPWIPDEENKSQDLFSAHTEITSEPQAAGDFTKAFMIAAKSAPPERETGDQGYVSKDKLKAEGHGPPTDFTQVFDEFKSKELSHPVDQEVRIPPSVEAPASSNEGGQEDKGIGFASKENRAGEFTRAFSKLELAREIPNLGTDNCEEQAGPIVPTSPVTPSVSQKNAPQMSDFTAAFQRALGSKTFTPKPASPPIEGEPDFFSKAAMPGVEREPTDQSPPVFDWPSKTGAPFIPAEEGPSSLTMLMKNLRRDPLEANALAHTPSNAEGNSEATNIFQVRAEPPAVPLVSEGPSKFTAFMKLSELRSAEENAALQASVPAPVPSFSPPPNTAWPPPAHFPAMQMPPQQAPILQSPYTPPPPPQVAPPSVPVAPIASPTPKLVAYLPLILILNGLVLLAILLVVMFAIKK